MNIPQLQYFRCLAKTEHMGRASEILNVTQPAISAAIQRLENELGVKLFDRKKRNIMLNENGKRFLQYVEPALDTIENGLKEMNRVKLQSSKKKSVDIMAQLTFLEPELMGSIYKKYPDIQVRSHLPDYSSIKDKLLDGTIDFCALSPPYESDEVETVTLRIQKMGIVTSRNHPLADLDEAYFKDLVNENFATYFPGTPLRLQFDEFCRACGGESTIKIVFESSSLRDMLSSVSSGHCIAFCSLPAIKNFQKTDMHLISLKDDLAINRLAISYLKGKTLRPLVKGVINTIVRYYAKRDDDNEWSL